MTRSRTAKAPGLFKRIVSWRPWRRTLPVAEPRGFFKRNRNQFDDTPVRGRETQELMTIRRWEAGQRNRLNEGQWKNIQLMGTSINDDLVTMLEDIRARCHIELANNPIIAGIVDTYVTDVVGKGGPTLQVLSENVEYNKALEQVWRDWFAMPDLNRQMSGASMLRQWVRSEFPNGSFLAQKVTDDTREGAIKLALLNIDAQRLMTPMRVPASEGLMLGIKRTNTGQPLKYFIQEAPSDELLEADLTKFATIDAEFIIHGFEILEPGQATGVPRMMPCLDVASDLRAYDKEVLTSARHCARQSGWFFTEHPDAEYFELTESESTKSEPGVNSAAPPGWKWEQADPKQPIAHYVDYRDERLLELGLPFHMPLLIVKQSAKEHNYSGARFDSQGYDRGIESYRADRLEIHLHRLGREVQREAMLAARAGKLAGKLAVLANPPDDVQFLWTWQPRPHVDPAKEAEGVGKQLETHSTSLIDVLHEGNTDIDTFLKKQARVIAAYKKANVPLPAYLREEPPPAPGPGAPGKAKPGGAGDEEEKLPAARPRRDARSHAHMRHSELVHNGGGHGRELS